MSATLDRQRLALNEQAVLSVTVSGEGSSLPNPQIPEMPNFQVYNAGRAQNFSWINGKASASVTHNFVLTPLQEGRFTIPPIRAEKDGQTVQTGEMSLDVVKSDSASIPEARAQAGAPAPSPAPEKRQAAIFVSGTVDKTSVFVGEQVVYSFRMYNRVNLLRQPSYRAPETQGFWSEDLPPQRNFQSTVQGVPYQVTEVRTALFPTTPGKARVGSAQLSVALENVGADPFSNDFFASFFGRAEEKVLRTDPVTITVRPLPDPKPAGFKGAVGEYAISAALDKRETAVGQPVTLTVAVSGRGNIKSLPDIALPALANFRTLTDNAAVNIEKQDGQVRGSKVFKTVLIPTASGELTVPPVSYVYFDTNARAYKTISTKPFTLQVLPGAAGTVAGSSAPLPPGPSSSSPGIQRLSEDIHYIRTPRDIESQGPPLYRRAWFRWMNLLALFGVLGLALWRLYEKLFLANPMQVRFKAAHARAMNSITKAEKALSGNDLRTCADALAAALQGYIADKLGAGSPELSLKAAVALFREKNVSEHSGEKVRNVWESLDLIRFAPAQARPEDLRQAIERVRHVIEELEKAVLWR